LSPTRTQKVFPLSAWVMANAPPRHPADPVDPRAPAGMAEGRAGCADGAWTDPQPTVTAAARQAARPA